MRKSKGDWAWLRDEGKISWLAEVLGVDRQVVDYWIAGRNDPDFLSTLKLVELTGSVEELERRAKVKVQLNLPSDLNPSSPIGLLTDRNYAYLLSVTEHLKFISRFQELHAQSYALLKNVAAKDKILTAKLWFDVGYAQLMLGHPLDAVESADKARKLLPAKKSSTLLADTHWLAGECLRVVGKLSEAYPHLDEARKIYKRLGTKPSFHESGQVWLEWDLGRYFAAYGRYDTALEHFKRLEKLAKKTWLAEAQVIATWSRGDIADTKSEFGSAIASYLYAKGLAGVVGNRFWEAGALWRIAEVYRKLGQFKTAIATTEEVRRSFESIGNLRMVAKADCVLAACYLQTGELSKAKDLYNNSIRVFTDNEDVPMQQSVLLGLELLHLADESQKSHPDYRKLLQDFLDIDTNRTYIYDPYLAIYHDLAYAETVRLSGYAERALTHYDAVIKASNKYGYQLEKAHALLGMVMTKLMKAEADRSSCHEALKLYQKVGSSWGQVQALITHAYIEYEMGEAYSHLLQQAVMQARANSLYSESQLIKNIVNQKSLHKENHVLLFVHAV